ANLTFSQLRVCAVLSVSWDRDIVRVSGFLVEAMKEKRNMYEMQELASGLVELAEQVPEAKAGDLASLLVAAVKEKGRTTDEMRALATGLGVLGGKVPEAK